MRKLPRFEDGVILTWSSLPLSLSDELGGGAIAAVGPLIYAPGSADFTWAHMTNNIDDVTTLRSIYGSPSERAVKKEMTALDVHCRNFIALSPFLTMATCGADGRLDCSPRGDAPGFVQVLNERTLLIPDRRGNNRVDSLSNIVEQGGIGLLFMVPGMNETLRVNGRARIVTDDALLEPLAVKGRAPRSGILVDVDEAFLQCAKALVRSHLWDPAQQIDRSSFASMGQMLADQIEGMDGEAFDQEAADPKRYSLY